MYRNKETSFGMGMPSWEGVTIVHLLLELLSAYPHFFHPNYHSEDAIYSSKFLVRP